VISLLSSIPAGIPAEVDNVQPALTIPSDAFHEKVVERAQ
jgi:hypothetical protein